MIKSRLDEKRRNFQQMKLQMANGIGRLIGQNNSLQRTKARELLKGFLGRCMVDTSNIAWQRDQLLNKSIPCRSSSYLSWQPAQDHSIAAVEG